jgi:hypothetical protein
VARLAFCRPRRQWWQPDLLTDGGERRLPELGVYKVPARCALMGLAERADIRADGPDLVACQAGRIATSYCRQ